MTNARFSILQARAVADPRITNSQFRALAALGIYGDEEGWCFPKLSTLGEQLHKSRQAVSKDLQKLKELGYIQIKPQHRKDGSRMHNLYRLIFDDVPLQPDVDTPSTPCLYPSTPEVDTPSTPEVDALTTHYNDPLIIDLEEARAYYFDIFGRKRWANKRQEEYFTNMLEKHGRETLIKAIDWAALKNISDLARIDKAAETMNKKPKGELKREGMGIQL